MAKNKSKLQDYVKTCSEDWLKAHPESVFKEILEIIPLEFHLIDTTTRSMTWAPIQLFPNEIQILAAFQKAGNQRNPYRGGVFYIRMSLAKDYPLTPPKCRFLTKIYHPDIDKADIISENLLKPHNDQEKMRWRRCGIKGPLVDISCITLPQFELSSDGDTFFSTARARTEKYAMGEAARWEQWEAQT